jgi:L-alanine-DL-glutamate epimerase-like enolase superfamily enzyme
VKITSAEIILYDIPLIKIFKNSLSSKSTQKSLVLVLTTDEGFTGMSSIEPDSPNYSEETWYGIKETTTREFFPILLSEDPQNIEQINTRMNDKIYGHFMSKSLVETALFDLNAKKNQTQVYKFIGGDSLRPIPLIGWIGISEADQIVSETKHFLDKGFECIKYKISNNVENTIKNICSVRKQFGYEFKIRLDANQTLSKKQTLKLIDNISRYEISLLEQPINRDDIEEMAAIKRYSTIPIMADESAASIAAVKILIWAQACDIIKIKIMRSGGINAAMQILALAKENGIRCVIGNGFSTSLGTSIEASFYLANNYLEKYAEFVGPLKMKRDVVKTPIRIENGKLIPQNGFGYGYDKNDLEL